MDLTFIFPQDGHDNPAYFPKPPVPGSESWC